MPYSIQLSDVPRGALSAHHIIRVAVAVEYRAGRREARGVQCVEAAAGHAREGNCSHLPAAA